MRPIKYLVLVAEQLSKADKVEVQAQARVLHSGPEASAFCLEKKKQAIGQWQYEILDLRGRIGVLKYRGAEVALFFRRQIQESEPFPLDPVPEGVIREPLEAWQRLDLLGGTSARQVSGKVSKTNRNLEQNLRLAEAAVQAKQGLLDTVETENYKLQKRVEDRDKQIASLKMRLKQTSLPKKG